MMSMCYRISVFTASTFAVLFAHCACAQSPSVEQFRSAALACVGTDPVKRQVVEQAAQKVANNVEDLKTLYKFIVLFPDTDRIKVYEIYVGCIVKILPTVDTSSSASISRGVPDIVAEGKDVIVESLLFYCAESNNATCPDTNRPCVKPEPGNVFVVDDRKSFADDSNLHIPFIKSHDGAAWGISKSAEKICVSADASVDKQGRNSRVNAKLIVREKMGPDSRIPKREFPESAGPFDNLQ